MRRGTRTRALDAVNVERSSASRMGGLVMLRGHRCLSMTTLTSAANSVICDARYSHANRPMTTANVPYTFEAPWIRLWTNHCPISSRTVHAIAAMTAPGATSFHETSAVVRIRNAAANRTKLTTTEPRIERTCSADTPFEPWPTPDRNPDSTRKAAATSSISRPFNVRATKFGRSTRGTSQIALNAFCAAFNTPIPAQSAPARPRISANQLPDSDFCCSCGPSTGNCCSAEFVMLSRRSGLFSNRNPRTVVSASIRGKIDRKP
jgi:hypothetical protein